MHPTREIFKHYRPTEELIDETAMLKRIAYNRQLPYEERQAACEDLNLLMSHEYGLKTHYAINPCERRDKQ